MICRIKERLAEIGMTREEFGRKLGVAESMVSKYINAMHIPKVDRALKIARILECKVEELWIREA